MLENIPGVSQLIRAGSAELEPGFAGIKWVNWATFIAFAASMFLAVEHFDVWLARKFKR
jgi:hypothetical protein